MNIGEANAVNHLVLVVGTSSRSTNRLPSTEELQAAVDLLLKGSYKALGAGLMPGDVTVKPGPRR